MMPTEDLTKLATLLGATLRDQDMLLATAESCTGGWVAQTVTAVAGSSRWFERGFVTYSNAAKMEMLSVRANTLNAHGAVSEQTAGEMAVGALAHSHAQVAVAITGIAGPEGGSPDKPVGTVCFAWARTNRKVATGTRHFSGDRDSVRHQAVQAALKGVLELLDD
jgi:nicotinamide-nucleotide amidase